MPSSTRSSQLRDQTHLEFLAWQVDPSPLSNLGSPWTWYIVSKHLPAWYIYIYHSRFPLSVLPIFVCFSCFIFFIKQIKFCILFSHSFQSLKQNPWKIVLRVSHTSLSSVTLKITRAPSSHTEVMLAAPFSWFYLVIFSTSVKITFFLRMDWDQHQYIRQGSFWRKWKFMAYTGNTF